MSITKLGRYDIVRVLGRGAMGLVYEARDPNLDRRVAIKTIKVENLTEEAALEYEARFRTEARSAARLQHPNIVSVYDSDRHGDIAYLVMEFIQGEDLKHHLDSGRRYSLEQLLRMVRDLLSALDYAHQQNIVHRDVKPANLLIEADGRVKLTDFGVARIQDSGEATRTKGSMVGTLKYMSPEQVQGQPVDSRADLFAAGIVLYQLLTGKRPFDGDSEFAIIHQIVAQTQPPPSSFNSLLPVALDAVLERALAKRREDRFATAREFAQALQEAAGQVSDQTIVPATSYSGRSGSGGTGTGPHHRSRTGGSSSRSGAPADESGSTVTQELELVYWKDVKDSADTQDLEGFLDRFPDGIYADLARRRLKKLLNPVHSDHSGSRASTVPGHGAVVRYNEHTRLEGRETGVATAPLTDTTTTGATADTKTLVAAEPTLTSNTSEAIVKPVADTSEPPATPVPPVRRSKGPLFAVAGLVVLVAAGLAFKLSSPSAPVSEPVAAPVAATAPAANPPAPTVPPPAAVAAPVVVPAPAVVVPVAAVPASAASKAVVAPATKLAAKPTAPTSVPGSMQLPAQAPVQAAAVPTPAPAPRPLAAQAEANAAALAAPSNPRQACEGRMLLGFQICMTEQCAKPAFSNHPACVERRAAEKARIDSQSTSRN